VKMSLQNTFWLLASGQNVKSYRALANVAIFVKVDFSTLGISGV
jgi:hypothetical protein